MTVPTPRNVLIHTITHKIYLGRNAEGNKFYDTGTEIKYVRILYELSAKTTTAKGNPIGKYDDSKTILYYDIKSSLPSSHVFHLDDIVEYDGKEFIVKEIKGDKSHHYEIVLV